MPRAARLILPLLLMVPLSGCLTDPFSMKPEVPGVELPAKPAPAEQTAGSEQDLSWSRQVQRVFVTGFLG